MWTYNKVLEYPKIEYKLGEFKTPSDMNRLVDDLTEFIKKKLFSCCSIF